MPALAAVAYVYKDLLAPKYDISSLAHILPNKLHVDSDLRNYSVSTESEEILRVFKAKSEKFLDFSVINVGGVLTTFSSTSKLWLAMSKQRGIQSFWSRSAVRLSVLYSALTGV
jgi:hypothetical protein